MMTIKRLREILADEPPENDVLELKVWLPGSRISLSHGKGATLTRQGDVLLIEGNLDVGSVLR